MRAALVVQFCDRAVQRKGGRGVLTGKKIFPGDEPAKENTDLQCPAVCAPMSAFVLADYFLCTDGGEPEAESVQAGGLEPDQSEYGGHAAKHCGLFGFLFQQCGSKQPALTKGV